jgi:hypothetical protein
MQELVKRVGRTSNLSAAEVDGNFTAVKTAVDGLEKRAVGTSTLSKWHRSTKAVRTITWSGDSTTDATSTAMALKEGVENFTNKPGAVLSNVQNFFHGYSGATPDFFSATPSILSEIVEDEPDLVVYSWGINYARQNTANDSTADRFSHLRASIVTNIEQMLTALPNTSILLRMPNRLSADPRDPSAPTPYLVPSTEEGAKAASDLLRAVYLSLENVYPDVVLFDTQRYVTGIFDTKPADFALSAVLGDALHPVVIFRQIGEEIIKFIAESPAGEYIEVQAKNAAAVHYEQDYLSYFGSVFNPDKYWCISAGICSEYKNGVDSEDLVSFNNDADPLSSASNLCAVGDVVLIGNKAYRPTDLGINNIRNRIALRGSIVQAAAPVQLYTRMGVYRHKYVHNLQLQEYLQNTIAYPYTWRGTIVYAGNGGNNFIAVAPMPGELSTLQRTAMLPTDKIYVEGAGWKTVGDYVQGNFSGNLTLRDGTADFTGLNGKTVVVVGNHPYEDGSRYKRVHPDYPWMQTN